MTKKMVKLFHFDNFECISLPYTLLWEKLVTGVHFNCKCSILTHEGLGGGHWLKKTKIWYWKESESETTCDNVTLINSQAKSLPSSYALSIEFVQSRKHNDILLSLLQLGNLSPSEHIMTTNRWTGEVKQIQWLYTMQQHI